MRKSATLAAMLALAMPLAAQETPVPRIASKDGRHALIVDGAPFLMLGAQVNNSSAWPAAMAKVWPTMEALHVNTVEVPIAWEQIEREEGKFDFSYLDLLLAQARERNLRLVQLSGEPFPCRFRRGDPRPTLHRKPSCLLGRLAHRSERRLRLPP